MKTGFFSNPSKYGIFALFSLCLLTSCTPKVLEPICSPDGKRIAFVSESIFSRETIETIDDKSFKKTRIETNLEMRGLKTLAWSPDSQRITLSITKASSQERLEHRIYIIGSDEVQSPIYLAKGITPSWSPDGKMIAFASSDYEYENWNIYRINTDGSGLLRLTRKLSDVRDPSWSPNGNQLLFSASNISSKDLGRSTPFIYITRSDGKTQPARLVEGSNPVWAPSGFKIAFYSRNRIKIMSIHDKKVVTLPEIAGGFPSSLKMNWLSSGLKILVSVAYCVENKADCAKKIYLVNTDGSENPNLLTEGSSPSWSPSGKIFFENHGHLYSVHEDGSNLVQLR